jgi:aryl-alcohol dehydrogenase-like predicted oxidoreductase
LCENENVSCIEAVYNWCLRNQNLASLITNVCNFNQLNSNIEYNNAPFNPEISFKLDQLFNNLPVDQYTGLKFKIDERKI